MTTNQRRDLQERGYTFVTLTYAQFIDQFDTADPAKAFYDHEQQGAWIESRRKAWVDMALMVSGLLVSGLMIYFAPRRDPAN